MPNFNEPYTTVSLALAAMAASSSSDSETMDLFLDNEGIEAAV